MLGFLGRKREAPGGVLPGCGVNSCGGQFPNRSSSSPSETLFELDARDSRDFSPAQHDQVLGFQAFREKWSLTCAVNREMFRIPLGVRAEHSSNSRALSEC